MGITHGGNKKCKILIARHERKGPLAHITMVKWDDNIKKNFRKIGFENVNWIDLAEDNCPTVVFLNMVAGFIFWQGNELRLINFIL